MLPKSGEVCVNSKLISVLYTLHITWSLPLVNLIIFAHVHRVITLAHVHMLITLAHGNENILGRFHLPAMQKHS